MEQVLHSQSQRDEKIDSESVYRKKIYPAKNHLSFVENQKETKAGKADDEYHLLQDIDANNHYQGDLDLNQNHSKCAELHVHRRHILSN